MTTKAAARATDSVLDVSVKEALDIYLKQSDNLHKLWAYFQVVSLAMLGYSLAFDKAAWPFKFAMLMSLAYAIFSLSNLWVIVVSQKELISFGRAVRLAARGSGAVGRQLTVKATCIWAISAFHAISMVAVLAVMWNVWFHRCWPIGQNFDRGYLLAWEAANEKAVPACRLLPATSSPASAPQK